MLSQIAKSFDPIGLLGPVIIKAKILMQRLWQSKCDWDESVSPKILNKVTFPRKVVIQNAKSIQVHGFCDVSETAYGACIYIRSQNKEGETYVNLLCSKTRVAPLKSLTIPRLELSAALLLSSLLRKVLQALDLEVDKVHLWSDSTITLQWINTQPYLLKTFVANHVSQIRNISDPMNWRYASTKQNAADCISRGQMPTEFIQNHIWMQGPEWLKNSESQWPVNEFPRVADSELKRSTALNTIDPNSIQEKIPILTKFSSLSKLKRIMAFCVKCINNLRSAVKCKQQLNITSRENVPMDRIQFSIDELNMGLNKLLILLQREHFAAK